MSRVKGLRGVVPEDRRSTRHTFLFCLFAEFLDELRSEIRQSHRLLRVWDLVLHNVEISDYPESFFASTANLCSHPNFDV